MNSLKMTLLSMRSHISVYRVPTMCSGSHGHGFHSRWGLRFFFVPCVGHVDQFTFHLLTLFLRNFSFSYISCHCVQSLLIIISTDCLQPVSTPSVFSCQPFQHTPHLLGHSSVLPIGWQVRPCQMVQHCLWWLFEQQVLSCLIPGTCPSLFWSQHFHP